MVTVAHGRYPEEEKIKDYNKNISYISVICGSVHWTILIVLRTSLGPIFTSVLCQCNVVSLPNQVFHVWKNLPCVSICSLKLFKCIFFFVSEEAEKTQAINNYFFNLSIFFALFATVHIWIDCLYLVFCWSTTFTQVLTTSTHFSKYKISFY